MSIKKKHRKALINNCLASNNARANISIITLVFISEKLQLLTDLQKFL